jgi:hypothetical protein
MKIFYLTVDGMCKIENTRVRARNLEMPDGPHPITNDSVWQDAKRLRPPVMTIIQDVFAAYGGSMAAEDIKIRMYEIEMASKAFKSPSLSKMWQRAFARIVDFVMKYGIPLFIVAMAGYAVINQLLGGK